MSFELNKSICARAVFPEINAGRPSAWQLCRKVFRSPFSSPTTLDISLEMTLQ